LVARKATQAVMLKVNMTCGCSGIKDTLDAQYSTANLILLGIIMMT
jgi:hypothetical protein